MGGQSGQFFLFSHFCDFFPFPLSSLLFSFFFFFLLSSSLPPWFSCLKFCQGAGHTMSRHVCRIFFFFTWGGWHKWESYVEILTLIRAPPPVGAWQKKFEKIPTVRGAQGYFFHPKYTVHLFRAHTSAAYLPAFGIFVSIHPTWTSNSSSGIGENVSDKDMPNSWRRYFTVRWLTPSSLAISPVEKPYSEEKNSYIITTMPPKLAHTRKKAICIPRCLAEMN